ncbi:unnamed protein product [Prunus armeniaca]
MGLCTIGNREQRGEGVGSECDKPFGTAPNVNPGVPGAGHSIQGGYANQASISPGMMGSYGNQGAMQGGYPNPQIGQGGSRRGQHGVGQSGGAPYLGH